MSAFQQFVFEADERARQLIASGDGRSLSRLRHDCLMDALVEALGSAILDNRPGPDFDGTMDELKELICPGLELIATGLLRRYLIDFVESEVT